jgi:hypothetical protein
MRASQPFATHDSPAVAVFRKKARGEPLTEAEEALLQSATRKPNAAGISHERVEAMLEERRRRKQG